MEMMVAQQFFVRALGTLCEKGIDEVLKSTTVFGNVSKPWPSLGQLAKLAAKHENLVHDFNTGEEEKVCRLIPAEGGPAGRPLQKQVLYAQLVPDSTTELGAALPPHH